MNDYAVVESADPATHTVLNFGPTLSDDHRAQITECLRDLDKRVVGRKFYEQPVGLVVNYHPVMPWYLEESITNQVYALLDCIPVPDPHWWQRNNFIVNLPYAVESMTGRVVPKTVAPNLPMIGAVLLTELQRRMQFWPLVMRMDLVKLDPVTYIVREIEDLQRIHQKS